MWNVSGRFHDIRQMASVMLQLGADAWRFLVLCLRPAPTLAAEILFLRKQLALYEERHIPPRRATNAARLVMVWLSYWFDWRPALRIVKPETLTRWHRQGFRLFWRWQSKPGRPCLTDKSEVCSPKSPFVLVFFLGNPFLEEDCYGEHTLSL
jgi:hypothetical protein